jgi:hypothetical protein
MRSWVLAAGLLAAATASGAQAADLYDDPPPAGRYGSAYEDPRYADIYKYPPAPPRYAVPGPGPYVGPYAGAPIPREPVYGNGYYGRDPRGRYADHCVPREVIKDRLIREGWHDFHDRDAQGDLISIRARRPSGRLFSLAIDRCTGEIVAADPLEGRGYGPYAYGGPGPDAFIPGPRRWNRPY